VDFVKQQLRRGLNNGTTTVAVSSTSKASESRERCGSRAPRQITGQDGSYRFYLYGKGQRQGILMQEVQAQGCGVALQSIAALECPVTLIRVGLSVVGAICCPHSSTKLLSQHLSLRCVTCRCHLPWMSTPFTFMEV